jgi:hypothetical protein
MGGWRRSRKSSAGSLGSHRAPGDAKVDVSKGIHTPLNRSITVAEAAAGRSRLVCCRLALKATSVLRLPATLVSRRSGSVVPTLNSAASAII